MSKVIAQGLNKNLSSPLFAIRGKIFITIWQFGYFYNFRLHLCNHQILDRNQTIITCNIIIFARKRVHICNLFINGGHGPLKSVSDLLFFPISFCIVRMLSAVLLPVSRIFLLPILLSILLIESVSLFSHLPALPKAFPCLLTLRLRAEFLIFIARIWDK